MRPRLNLQLQLLSYEFGVHQSTFSRLFAETIDIMFVRMNHLFFGLSVNN